jgi:hypothetical protein
MYIENIHTAKTHLSQLIKRALEPLVKLTPVQRDLTPRRGGQLKDRIRIAADFDLFDEELERLFYGEPE